MPANETALASLRSGYHSHNLTLFLGAGVSVPGEKVLPSEAEVRRLRESGK